MRNHKQPALLMRAVSFALVASFCSQMTVLGTEIPQVTAVPAVAIEAPAVPATISAPAPIDPAPVATAPVAAPVPVAAPAPAPAPKPQPKIWCSAQEIAMMEFVIEMEAHGGSYSHKKIIANIIINRVLSQRFPNSVSAVLHSKNQFTTISNYYSAKVKPDAYTINAVYEALYDTSDYSQGALFFYNPRHSSKRNRNWFENQLTFLFAQEGHRFFK